MADNYESLNQENEEIFGTDKTETRSFNSWIVRSGLKGISGLVLAIGFLPIVLWYIETSTFLITFETTLIIWVGVLLWATWYYLERKHSATHDQ